MEAVENNMEATAKTIASALSSLESKMDSLDTKIDSVRSDLNTKIGSLDGRMDSLKTSLNLLGLVIAVAAIAVTLAVVLGGDGAVTIEIGDSLAEALRDR